MNINIHTNIDTIINTNFNINYDFKIYIYKDLLLL